MDRLTITGIETMIAQADIDSVPIRSETRQASVAVILREAATEVESLFILRATKEGDPWSGHMAFPGGHRDPPDETLRHTAERETFEEIGLDLADNARFLGQINPVRANPRGRSINLEVVPFVYTLEVDDPELFPNHEVADVLWGSLSAMICGASFTHDERRMAAGHFHSFPGYAVGDQIVWGLTFRMLQNFFELLDPAFESTEF